MLWNGNGGRTYFYQSEIPYDPPDQPSYTAAPGTNGWASYKVADNVTSHEAWGLGVYSVFRHPNVMLTRAIEVPVTPNVRFHHMITVALDNLGEISNVIDDKGGPTHVAPQPRHAKSGRIPAVTDEQLRLNQGMTSQLGEEPIPTRVLCQGMTSVMPQVAQNE